MSEQVRMSGHPRPRIGKTQKDKSSGAYWNRFANAELRDAWLSESRGRSNIVPFPSHVGAHKA